MSLVNGMRCQSLALENMKLFVACLFPLAHLSNARSFGLAVAVAAY